jgi:hypothetical protein
MILIFDVKFEVSSANSDISIPGLLGMSAAYILHSNGARTAPYGTASIRTFLRHFDSKFMMNKA